jgi:hypothetical protein
MSKVKKDCKHPIMTVKAVEGGRKIKCTTCEKKFDKLPDSYRFTSK